MAQDLRNVNNIESLMTYFSEKLGWPVDPDAYYDIDDITYDFEAADLGLKEEAFAKITSLKQLRPLVDNQCWGIFFVNFESNRFEISALRKILSGLVPARRNADHAVWDKKDLLFLCTWGEQNKVTIGAAHFEDAEKGLPQIKMISCEPTVEDFTQINVFEQRLAKLAWPKDPSDAVAWHEAWASAFTTRYRQTIHDAHTLTVRLAEEAQNIRDRILNTLEIETSNGYVHLLFQKFRDTLVHDMTEQQFADMYAQTVVYGLFSARCMDETQEDFNAAEAVECIPNTNPFLKGLLQECLGSNNTKSKLSFDELEVGNIVDLLLHTKTDSIITDFNRQTGGGREEPVIHFYEEFLSEYDKTQRVQRGVYYTPQPVVNFIVRVVDDILRHNFGVEDGLASTATKKIKYLRQSKKRVDGFYRTTVEDEKEVPAIQILDPATGTGTFLRQTILQIYNNFCIARKGMSKNQIQAEWNAYVPEHLLPRLNGFELMMAPYAVAHMKLAMVLKDTGYQFDTDARMQVYLTNTLEKPGNSDAQLTLFDDPLAFESISANAVKENSGINVVIGNPPYSISSSNKGEWILSLLSDYKQGLNERKVNLDDDYIKFIRYGQYVINQAGSGILAYISNNSFLDGTTHRKMRYDLLREFNRIIIINLHGNSKRFEKAPDGSKDENVFDIQQGVSINILIKENNRSKTLAEVYYTDLYGLRQDKYDALNEYGHILSSLKKINPIEPSYFFIPMDFSSKTEYDRGFAIDELMKINSSGIQTKNDYLAIHYSEEETKQVQSDFLTLQKSNIVEKYSLKDSAGWKIDNAVSDIKTNHSSVEKILYRPYDWRYILYTNKSSGFLGRPREKVSRHFVEHENIGLLVRRTTPPVDFTHVYITDSLISEGVLGIDPNGREYVFPLYLYDNSSFVEKTPNMDKDIISRICSTIGQASVDPYDVLCYIYAILHSPAYRKKYADYLRINFPRIPYPVSAASFNDLVALGDKLIKTHLHIEKENSLNITYQGQGDNLIDGIKYKDGNVYINRAQFFTGISVDLWEQKVGGYAPLQKWLKLRNGRHLSEDEILSYITTVNAIFRTNKIMEQIDSFLSL